MDRMKESAICDAILKYGKDIINSEVFKNAATETHHLKGTVLDHTINVCVVCMRLAMELNSRGIKVREKELIQAALCHDLGMVGRDEKYKDRMDAWESHPKESARIARELIPDLSDDTEQMILTHMWPVAGSYPATSEAMILCMADKYASMADWQSYLTQHKYAARIKERLDEVMKSSNSCTEEDIHAVILLTSDMHGNIWGYSYQDDAETVNSGMARLYTYIEQVRAEEPAVFLVDGGDEIQGNIMTDMLAIKEPDSEHPVMTAMNHMKYDAMTLGNHEFDWGVGTLKKILSQAEFPVLGMNVLNPDGSFLTGNGWTIIERGGVKLAVIGVTTPDIPIWDGNKEGVSELTFEAGYAAVKRAVREIGDRADIFLVSAHMGQYAEYDEPGGSDAGEKIVFENPEVDILQVGHVHISVNGKIGKTPVIAVKDAARQIARIDVTLDHNKNIKEITTEIIEMAGFAPSEKIRMIPVVNKMHEKTITCIREAPDSIKKVVPAGDLIGSTTAKFQPENEIKGLPEWRLGDTPLTDLVLKVELLYSGADAAVTPLFRDISDLPEGPIHYGDIREIYFLDNVLCTVDVTGKELKNYMEWSAGAYNQWKPGDINISFNREYLYLKLDMFAGVDYEIDVSKPEGERIRNVMYKGEPLKDDTILKLAINNYRYEVCLKCMNLAAGKRSWQSSEFIRDMLVDYFRKNSPVGPVVDNNWRITGADLSKDDPRRAEIIGYIEKGLLPTPYYESYNLGDYDEIVKRVKDA